MPNPSDMSRFFTGNGSESHYRKSFVVWIPSWNMDPVSEECLFVDLFLIRNYLIVVDAIIDQRDRRGGYTQEITRVVALS